MKIKTQRVIFIIVCIAFLAFIGLMEYVRVTFPYEMGSPRIFFFTSPAGTPTAVIFHEGFVDRGATLYVSESQDMSQDLNKIGSLDLDGRWRLDSVLWSKDGTLIVSQGCVLNGKRLYTHCYDVKTQSSIIPSTKYEDNNWEYWAKHSGKIADLIEERGGIGISISEINYKSRKMGFWEWRDFLAKPEGQ